MLILFISVTCFSYAVFRSMVIWRKACTKGESLAFSTTEKALKVHLQPNLHTCALDANWSTISHKSVLKQTPYLVNRMRRISLTCAEGKYCSPIFGICFSHAVYRGKYLCSDGERLWHISLRSEHSFRRWKTQRSRSSSQTLFVFIHWDCNVKCMKLRGSCTWSLVSLSHICGLNSAWSFVCLLSFWHLGVFFFLTVQY